MIYSIEKTLSFLPYLCWGVIAVVFALMEYKTCKETVTDRPTAEPGRNGFVPPRGGYEYYVGGDTVVYIKRAGRSRWHVYLVQGARPSVPLKRDRHGTYFTVRSKTPAMTEKIIEDVFAAR